MKIVIVLFLMLSGCVTGNYVSEKHYDPTGKFIIKQVTQADFNRLWADTNVSGQTMKDGSFNFSYSSVPQSQIPGLLIEAFKLGAKSQGVPIE